MQAEAMEAMTRAFQHMERSLTPPERVPHRDSFVFRYTNKGIHEALVQKLARSISGLNAVAVLLESGYFQEAGVLFRTLDEIQEDIFFLASAETNGAKTERHDQYLNAFYAEAVFSRPQGSLEVPKPNLVPRKKIRAHTMNTLGDGVNVSQALAAGESVSTAYSGYVHAASENVMDMYGGDPPHFHLTGMLGTPRVATWAQEAENYLYRGLMATVVIAKAFGDRQLVDELYKFLHAYELANDHISAPPSGA
ncbi:MAG: hypothetical protein HOP03_00015 [Lysobacter sp.]|nr:hypothetical protein [Lysobacter sp.]